MELALICNCLKGFSELKLIKQNRNKKQNLVEECGAQS